MFKASFINSQSHHSNGSSNGNSSKGGGIVTVLDTNKSVEGKRVKKQNNRVNSLIET